MNDLVHALDGEPKGSADGLQTLAFGKAFADEVVAFFFWDMFFGDGF